MLKIKTVPHQFFQRHGDDLHITLTVGSEGGTTHEDMGARRPRRPTCLPACLGLMRGVGLVLPGAQVDLVSALVGFEKVIKHVDERDVKLSKPTVTSHGEVQRVRGQGMPKRTGSGGFGDLVVTWEVSEAGTGGGVGSKAAGLDHRRRSDAVVGDADAPGVAGRVPQASERLAEEEAQGDLRLMMRGRIRLHSCTAPRATKKR